MRCIHKNFILVVACVGALTACGGNDASSANSAVSAQSKQLVRSQKAQATDYQAVVQELYVAYYGRPADPAGLVYWEEVLLAANAPTDIEDLNTQYTTNAAVQSVINSFGTSAESTALYGSGNASSFVTAIYQNVLGRAPDGPGLTYWAGLIGNNTITQADAALAIAASASAEASTSSDEQVASNRLVVASYFTTQVASQNAASAYSGNVANTSARTMLNAVTATTNTTADETSVTNTIAVLFGSSASTLEVFAGNMGGLGSANGTGAAARFLYPTGVAADSAGNIYVTDASIFFIDASTISNNIIRKITPAGVVTTLAGTAGVTGSADGAGAAASFNTPHGIATDSAGNVYVTDAGNNTIRKITPAGVVTTLAGTAGLNGNANGTGAAARFNQPNGIAIDSAGNIYVADSGNNAIRKITPAGVVTTWAGLYLPGSGVTFAPLNYPQGVATDSAGNVYIVDATSVQKITPALVVTTLAGTAGILANSIGSANGTGAAASFNFPQGIAADSAGNVYVADTLNNAIRKITPAGVVTTLAGTAGVFGSANGTGAAASFYSPQGVATDSAGNVYVADTGNGTIREITAAGVVTTLAGSPSVVGSANGTGAAASFSVPNGIATDNAGNVYVADTGNDALRKITPAGVVSTLTGTTANFTRIKGVATDSAGNAYVADAGGVISKITPAGVITALAGSSTFGSDNGTGAVASFNTPNGIATDSAGNVYVADIGNGAIRKITPAGVVTTFATVSLGIVIPPSLVVSGSPTSTVVNYANGVATDNAGNVYVADTINNVIRKITAVGVVSTLAGTAGIVGNSDGSGAAARFNYPQGIATDSAGNVYVADTGNDTIRKITPAGVVSTVVGVPGQGSFLAGALPGVLSSPLGVAISGSSLYITTYNGVAVVNNVP